MIGVDLFFTWWFRSRDWKDFRACNIDMTVFNMQCFAKELSDFFLYNSTLSLGGKHVTVEVVSRKSVRFLK